MRLSEDVRKRVMEIISLAGPGMFKKVIVLNQLNANDTLLLTEYEGFIVELFRR